MKLILNRSFDFKTNCHKYETIDIDIPKYYIFASQLYSYAKPLYIVKCNDEEVCRLEDNNKLRPWLVIPSLFFSSLRAQYTLTMLGIEDNYVLKFDGKCYSMEMGHNIYLIKGHSKCIVTIWEDNKQVGLVKRIKSCLYGLETIEILFENHVSILLIILLTVFGWENYVGTVGGNRTLITFFPKGEKCDMNWRPQE